MKISCHQLFCSLNLKKFYKFTFEQFWLMLVLVLSMKSAVHILCQLFLVKNSCHQLFFSSNIEFEIFPQVYVWAVLTHAGPEFEANISCSHPMPAVFSEKQLPPAFFYLKLWISDFSTSVFLSNSDSCWFWIWGWNQMFISCASCF